MLCQIERVAYEREDFLFFIFLAGKDFGYHPVMNCRSSPVQYCELSRYRFEPEVDAMPRLLF